jgi:hypothetical protein
MNAVKVGLTLLTVAILVVPFVYVLVTYGSNPLDLVLPPQLQALGQNAIAGTNQDSSQNSQNSLLGLINNSSDIQAPQIVGTPQYDPATGDFSLQVNASNPINQPINVEEFSAQIASTQNSSLVGNVSLPQQIDIQPGQSQVINITGVIPQDMINQATQNGSLDLNSINGFVLKNVDVTVQGVHMHFDQINPSDYTSQLGQLLPGGT